MNFREWLTTREYYEDMTASDFGDSLGYEKGEIAGYVYSGGFILQHEEMGKGNQYHVIICNEEWLYDTLECAEMRLWIDWCEGEVGDDDIVTVMNMREADRIRKDDLRREAERLSMIDPQLG